MEYLCGKKVYKSSKLSSKSGWENTVCILYKFNLVFSFLLSVKICLSFCAQQLPVFCLKYLTMSALLKSSQNLGFNIDNPLRKLFVCVSTQLWSTRQYEGWCPWCPWKAQSPSETYGKLIWIILNFLFQLGGSWCPFVGCLGCTFSAGLACPSSSALHGTWLSGCAEKAPWGLWVLPWHWEKETGPCQSMCWQLCWHGNLCCWDADPRDRFPVGIHHTRGALSYQDLQPCMWERKTLETLRSVLKSTVQRKNNTSGKRLFLKTASVASSV